ncbi:hypothetical protein CHS0354_030317 [Potamilus streckersoni]|uniref:Uncharacterized protein n=1 Tax=Potamilus streckersoni TaxID=2493646 RepID=A0AAE0T4K7_9BIVA|nr:hypothetical protein CHS0354_030317 [Potamilus streckersoni]
MYTLDSAFRIGHNVVFSSADGNVVSSSDDSSSIVASGRDDSDVVFNMPGSNRGVVFSSFNSKSISVLLITALLYEGTCMT